jgi:predicted metal-dependent HD superfamily phosphohydrolase
LNLLKETEEFCIHRFADLDPAKYIYHNLIHTKEVVEACKILARNEGLSQDESELVTAAAWFHDIGYTEDYLHHEEISKKIATEFLSSRDLDPERIAVICGCIDATRIPQTPGNKLEEVLCDADMYHLTFSNFCERTELLRLERNLFLKGEVSMMDFLKESVRFLQTPYFTDYAKKMWTDLKAVNLEEVNKKILQRKAENDMSKSGLDYPGLISELKDENKSLKKKLSRRPMYTRGVDTMFRTTSRKQINLSAIADNKSNILITMNTLIISVVITLFVRRYQDYPQLIIPVLILILACLGSLVAAILSTRPIILKGEFKEEEVKKRGVNLLFFGNFFNTSFNEYDKAFKEIMSDEDHVYTMMVMDQYSQGKVLAKKFRLLRIAYDIFMYGFIAFILTVTLVMILYRNPA